MWPGTYEAKITGPPIYPDLEYSWEKFYLKTVHIKEIRVAAEECGARNSRKNVLARMYTNSRVFITIWEDEGANVWDLNNVMISEFPAVSIIPEVDAEPSVASIEELTDFLGTNVCESSKE